MSVDKNAVLEEMRKNLTLRNEGKDEYHFGYTHKGRTELISQSDYIVLIEIDGNMIVWGI